MEHYTLFSSKTSYLRLIHVQYAVGGSWERDAPDEEDSQHRVREDRCEVYDLEQM